MFQEVQEAATSRKLSGRSASDVGETRDKIGAFATSRGAQSIGFGRRPFGSDNAVSRNWRDQCCRI
jgi:hypothetical protein